MLTIQKATRQFDNGAGFRRLSVDIQEGEIVGLLGTSGCGKSTLLRVIAKLDELTEGKLGWSKSSKDVGMIFQEPRLFPWLTVEENVGFVKNSGHKDLLTVNEWLARVGLEGANKLYPKDLSGGMAQRVAIARALRTKPNLLLLDEPFSALDAFTKMQLQDLLLQLWKEEQKTMIFVTHDIDEALYVCDRILIMKGKPGEVIADIKVEGNRTRDLQDEARIRQRGEILSLLHVTEKEGEDRSE
ncbi:ABC transporter ATP-binding protein [Mangrovibacillus cuniculi]|uniref:ABC transporter ATP-binding protein n=1 Tax=Mangrovibacillus cuniculi TaxID=2593652 RepID=A0A7S8HGE8_9BACI|nr:ABC transporter ATP-binding protein [Mangrovibacillus cuniculi]QPC47481.1 ABC transporter ATP-binding protein [Mangrovibacillus cuniculi]